MKPPSLDTLDLAFPTIVRYIGLLTTLILIGFSIAGYVTETAPGFVAAAGMILYKTVHNASKSPDSDKTESKS